MSYLGELLPVFRKGLKLDVRAGKLVSISILIKKALL